MTAKKSSNLFPNHSGTNNNYKIKTMPLVSNSKEKHPQFITNSVYFVLKHRLKTKNISDIAEHSHKGRINKLRTEKR